MKHWAALTVLLYALALIVLTVPILLAAFGSWSHNGSNIGWERALKVYQAWGYWLWLAMLVAGQALLLLLPLKIAERRLPARRALRIPIIVTAFFLANLWVAGFLSVVCVAYGDNGPGAVAFFNPFTFNQTEVTNASSGFGPLIGMGVLTFGFWAVWAVIFRSFAKQDEPDTLLKRITRWLLRGSILELLIAVPSHVIVRRRDDCCAPAGTFWGIATGISIMLLCFGPGVFFLFVERVQRVKPQKPGVDKPN